MLCSVSLVHIFSSSLLCLCAPLPVKSLAPVVINTWPFTQATAEAWESLAKGNSALDAVQQVR